jgi:hypothetical protein
MGLGVVYQEATAMASSEKSVSSHQFKKRLVTTMLNIDRKLSGCCRYVFFLEDHWHYYFNYSGAYFKITRSKPIFSTNKPDMVHNEDQQK